MSTTSGSNIQWPSGSAYIVTDRGTGAYGVKDVQSAIPPITLLSVDFETDPIPGSGGGNLPWLTTVSVPHSGLRCFRSGAITNSQQSLWTFTNPIGAVSLTGWYRVSSEAGFDFLEIYKDAVTVPNRILQQSGTGNVWVQFTINVTGATTTILRFVKDTSDAAGLDTVFIDDLLWQTASQAAITNWEPFHLDTNNCLKVSLCSNHVIIDSLPAIEIMNDVGNPVPVSFTRLNCATDSVEICNDAGSPIPVSGTIELGATTLAALETITVLQGTSPWVVSGTVSVSNFPAVAHLDCSTDSVEICNDAGSPITVNVSNIPHVIVDSIPEVEIKNDVGNPVPVSFTRLSCATDSIEICNDVGNPVPISFTRLNCVTDSIEICNDAGSPITVNVSNIPHVIVDSIPEVEIKNDSGNPVPVSFTRLNCVTDSIEICNDAGSPITVNVSNIPHVIVDSIPEVEIKNDSGNPVSVSFTRLSCATDSIEICNDIGNPIPVSGTVSVNNFPAVAHLACATDKVGACQEGTWNVGVTGTVIPGKRSLLGLYYATSGPIAYTTAADSATGGDLWLVNTSNTVVVYLRSVRFTSLLDSLAILTNLPTIRMERMTFTGTPSGTSVTPAKRDSLDAANTGTIRTAATGMTITAGAAIESFSPPTADVIGGLLSVNATASIPVEQLFVGDLDSFITLRQNEGIVFRQNTAGNATENRMYWLNLVWEEI